MSTLARPGVATGCCSLLLVPMDPQELEQSLAQLAKEGYV